MNCPQDFEIEVVKRLTADVFSAAQIEEILSNYEFAGFEYTGAGYFLSITHSNIPYERIVCSHPVLTGQIEGVILCGFVIFIENHQLTIECHEWGEFPIPEDFRNRKIKTAEAEI